MARACVLCFLLLLVGSAGLVSSAGAQGREAVAIVVHADVEVEGLSFNQLRRIFLGEQQFWPQNQRITLLVRAPQAYERDIVLQRIYEMSESQFRQFWIAKIFRSEVVSGPKIVYSNDMALELVTSLPGSITFMRASDVSGNVKVLRVDGKLPGERGYRLQ